MWDRIKKVLPLFAVLLTVTAIGIVIYLFQLNRDTLFITHKSGMYSESFDLRFITFKKGKIVYTTDGHAPELGYKNLQEYTGPINLVCEDETTTYSFQVCCYFEDGTSTEVFRRDYVLDPQGAARFTTTYVVSITGTEEELFGDEEGIFVRGNRYYEYMESHPDTNVLGVKVPANYYQDVEVPVHAAIFLKDGTQIIDQNCGVQIYGNVSRQHNQKSFRLYARYDYDTVNEFSYPFFPTLITEDGKEPLDDYQRLSFHNTGNDNGFGFIRTELTSELARQSGFQDTLAAESVTVYINGKYQGVYWLQSTFDDRYFKEKYGDYEGEMAIGYGTLGKVEADGKATVKAMDSAREYREFCKWIETADLTVEENWDRVCRTIDVDNFAHYFALQYYTGNLDWPQNNVKVYRYMPNENEEYREGTVFDGRYRYLLFDTDYSFGLIFLDIFGHSVRTERLNDYVNSNAHTDIFRAAIKRDDFKNLFMGYVLGFMNGTFNMDHVSDTMYNLNVTRYDELRYMMEETGILKGSIWEAWGISDKTMADTEAEWNEIVGYAKERPAVVVGELQSVLGCGVPFPLNVIHENANRYYLGNIPFTGSVNGTWIEGVPIHISHELPTGMYVKGYEVNGIFYEGESLSLMPEEISGYSAGITITAVIEEVPVGDLQIHSYRTDGSEDYITLRNNGTADVQLSEYSITDNEEDLSKGHLPVQVLAPGETFVIYGEKYSGDMADDSLQVPFSWNDEEPVILYHQSGKIITTGES